MSNVNKKKKQDDAQRKINSNFLILIPHPFQANASFLYYMRLKISNNI